MVEASLTLFLARDEKRTGVERLCPGRLHGKDPTKLHSCFGCGWQANQMPYMPWHALRWNF